MSSPCIKHCVLSGELCTGCGRTREEIGNWTRISACERHAIMERLAKGEWKEPDAELERS